MEFLTPSRPVSAPEFNAPPFVEVGEPLKAKEEPDFLSEFQFAQTLIPLEGGQQSLRLLRPLHLKINPKDNGSQHGLLAMVGTRRKLLKYLRLRTPERYLAIVQRLGLRR